MLSKNLVVCAVLCIGSNTHALFSKNTVSANLTAPIPEQRLLSAPAGNYVCIDYASRPIGMEFKILDNKTYTTEQGLKGKIFYAKTVGANNRRSVTWTGSMSKWDESFYMENKGAKAFVLLGKGDRRRIVVPSCNWVNPNQEKR